MYIELDAANIATLSRYPLKIVNISEIAIFHYVLDTS